MVIAQTPQGFLRSFLGNVNIQVPLRSFSNPFNIETTIIGNHFLIRIFIFPVYHFFNLNGCGTNCRYP